jgi:hypothetical protein
MISRVYHLLLDLAAFVTSGFLGFGKKHYLVPAEESPGTVTLTVNQQAVESAPTLSDPHAGPDERLQRAAREHYSLGAVL